MKVIIDTSSLLSLVRYYLPFDANNKLFDFMKARIQHGDIVIVDAVLQECAYTSKRLVLKELSYLADKVFLKQNQIPAKTNDMLPPSTKKFYNLVDNNFRTQHSRRLSGAEYEVVKKEFLESADARMIIYGMVEANKGRGDEVVIVTEESAAPNDHKAFKKIPALCSIIKLKVMTLPQLLKTYQGVNFEFK